MPQCNLGQQVPSYHNVNVPLQSGSARPTIPPTRMQGIRLVPTVMIRQVVPSGIASKEQTSPSTNQQRPDQVPHPRRALPMHKASSRAINAGNKQVPRRPRVQQLLTIWHVHTSCSAVNLHSGSFHTDRQICTKWSEENGTPFSSVCHLPSAQTYAIGHMRFASPYRFRCDKQTVLQNKRTNDSNCEPG